MKRIVPILAMAAVTLSLFAGIDHQRTLVRDHFYCVAATDDAIYAGGREFFTTFTLTDGALTLHHAMDLPAPCYDLVIDGTTAYLATGDLERGRAELEEVLRVEPENTSASMNLGLIHFKEGDLDAAAQRFRENLEISGASPDLYVLSHIHLGLIALESGEWRDALGAFRAALEARSGNFDRSVQLAFMHSRFTDQETLEEALQQLRALGDPGDRAVGDSIVARVRGALGLPGAADPTVSR